MQKQTNQLKQSDEILENRKSVLQLSQSSSFLEKADKHPLQSAVSLNRNTKSPPKSPLEKNNTKATINQQFKKPSIDDFICIGQLGRGSYGEVVLARQKSNDEDFAIKIVDKRFMARERKQYQVYVEREMLFNLKHPGIINLSSTFQTQEKLYFVMEYIENGDLAEFIKLNQQKLTYDSIKFYIAEIVLILEFLHSKGVAHRDIKPENILVTKTRHLKMIDFGTASIYEMERAPKELAKRITDIRARFRPIDNPGDMIFDRGDESKHRATFVGTAEYVSPELLDEDICDGQADLWALGCILFKMLTGKTPFNDNSEYLVFQKVKAGTYTIPDNIPAPAVSLIQSLLVRDPQKRLGGGTIGQYQIYKINKIGSDNDYNQLKQHPFFQGINFETIFQIEAPFYQFIKVQRNETMLDPDLQLGKKNEEKKKQKSSILFQGLVQLKTLGFLYKPVEMVLKDGQNHLSIHLYDPENSKLYKIISLTQDVHIYTEGKGILIIEQPDVRNTEIKEIQHPVNKWVDTIEKSRQNKKKLLNN